MSSSSILKCYLQHDDGSIIVDQENNATVIDENGVPLCYINLNSIDFTNETSVIVIDGFEYILHIQTGNQSTYCTDDEKDFCWNETTDLLYLDLYSKYKPLVGKKFRTKNRMFTQICSDMRSAPYHYNINEEQVKNHDKTIQRRMKKYFANTGPKSTGDHRKTILNERKVLEVYGTQYSITPEYVLTREGERTQEEVFNRVTVEKETEAELGEGTSSSFNEMAAMSSSTEVPTPVEIATGPSTFISGQPPIKRNKREGKTASCIQAIKESVDTQSAIINQRSELYQRMVEINENWVRENIRLREEANLERRRRNDLLEQHVSLLQQLLSKSNNNID